MLSTFEGGGRKKANWTANLHNSSPFQFAPIPIWHPIWTERKWTSRRCCCIKINRHVEMRLTSMWSIHINFHDLVQWSATASPMNTFIGIPMKWKSCKPIFRQKNNFLQLKLHSSYSIVNLWWRWSGGKIAVASGVSMSLVWLEKFTDESVKEEEHRCALSICPLPCTGTQNLQLPMDFYSFHQ